MEQRDSVANKSCNEKKFSETKDFKEKQQAAREKFANLGINKSEIFNNTGIELNENEFPLESELTDIQKSYINSAFYLAKAAEEIRQYNGLTYYLFLSLSQSLVDQSNFDFQRLETENEKIEIPQEISENVKEIINTLGDDF